MLDDFESAARRFDGKITGYDIMFALSLLQEPIVGAPSTMVLKNIEKATGKTGKKKTGKANPYSK